MILLESVLQSMLDIGFLILVFIIFYFFSSKIFYFQVPHNAVPGSYKLKVEGNFEGDIGGSGFRNETDLHFSERFLTILIQTNQLVYNLEQTSKSSKVL